MMKAAGNPVARGKYCIASCLLHFSKVPALKKEYTLSRQHHCSSLLEPHELKLIVSFMDLAELADPNIHEHTIK